MISRESSTLLRWDTEEMSIDEMSGPSNIKIQTTGAEEIGNGHGRCHLKKLIAW
jgi:hypothetical protein